MSNEIEKELFEKILRPALGDKSGAFELNPSIAQAIVRKCKLESILLCKPSFEDVIIIYINFILLLFIYLFQQIWLFFSIVQKENFCTIEKRKLFLKSLYKLKEEKHTYSSFLGFGKLTQEQAEVRLRSLGFEDGEILSILKYTRWRDLTGIYHFMSLIIRFCEFH